MKMHRLARRLAMALVVLVPAVAAVAAVYWSSGQERAAAHKLLEQQASQLAAGVDAELNRTVAILKTLAVSTSLLKGDLEAFHGLATRVVAAERAWDNVQLISSTGEHLLNARLPYGAELPRLNRPDLPMRAAFLRQPVISDVEMAVVARRMLTAVYVPVVRDDPVRYVLAAAIEPPNWTGMLRSRLPPNMHAALLDRHSFVITSTFAVEDAARMTSSTDSSAPPSTPGELAHDLRRIGAPGAELFYAAEQRAPFSGWRVVTFMPRSEAGALHRHWPLLLTLTLAGVACYAIAVLVVLGKRR